VGSEENGATKEASAGGKPDDVLPAESSKQSSTPASQGTGRRDGGKPSKRGASSGASGPQRTAKAPRKSASRKDKPQHQRGASKPKPRKVKPVSGASVLGYDVSIVEAMLRVVLDIVNKVRSGDPSIDWSVVSAALRRQSGQEVKLSPSECHRLWKFLAYGKLVVDANAAPLKEPSSSTLWRETLPGPGPVEESFSSDDEPFATDPRMLSAAQVPHLFSKRAYTFVERPVLDRGDKQGSSQSTGDRATGSTGKKATSRNPKQPPLFAGHMPLLSTPGMMCWLPPLSLANKDVDARSGT